MQGTGHFLIDAGGTIRWAFIEATDGPDKVCRLPGDDEITAAARPMRRLARVSVSAVSEDHFARSFKQAFGVPPHGYLPTRRIERATALLRDTGLSITEIAFHTGWENTRLPPSCCAC
jgi:methylphosphotriester-DNA--protein-cysteine methyltransferase